MNRLEELGAAIANIPDEYASVRNVLRNLLAQGELHELRVYSLGLRDMALHLTSDDALLEPLTQIREVLR